MNKKQINPLFQNNRSWFGDGRPWIWLNAGAISISLVMVFGVLLLVMVRGMGYFWPSDIVQFEFQQPGAKQSKTVFGELYSIEQVPRKRLAESGLKLKGDSQYVERYTVKTNREGSSNQFKTYLKSYISKETYPTNIVVIERREGGNLYGYLHTLKKGDQVVANKDAILPELPALHERATELHEKVYHIEKDEIGGNYKREDNFKDKLLKLNYYKSKDKAAYKAIEDGFAQLKKELTVLNSKREALRKQMKRDSLQVTLASGKVESVSLDNIIRLYQPNNMGTMSKVGHYLSKFWEFLTDDPREANTEGGIYPAIFGTVVMVFLMTILVTPFGVIAAIYLHEYAKQNALTRLIRISVNNLAGVPSIVFGVFGFGFFVLWVGGSLDGFLFPEREGIRATFKSPSLIWASLTLALLTLPVVIVATEEGLSRVPKAIREGSLALGATKAETLWRTVVPMSSPGIMTGVILAIARAAGEVAPLMLVGVVAVSPSLAIDGYSPFIHLDRAIQHLGYQIFSVGFQSPNSEAARPLVYATSFVLVMVIVILNLSAISIRNRLREKYRTMEH